MDFKQCKVLADIKYCETTNVEYEQYYIDCLHSRLIRSGVDASDI